MNNEKIRVAVICGGRSGEHEVSLISGSSVARALNPAKYQVTLIGIDPKGLWRSIDTQKILSGEIKPEQLSFSENSNRLQPKAYSSNNFIENAQGPFDVIFPVLHGTYGEDGTIQGLLELANIPYVGSGVVGSSVGMDKDISRRLLAHAGIPVVPTITLKSNMTLTHEQMITAAEKEFGFPFFVKPANAGSSVGVHKVKNRAAGLAALEDAFQYDTKVLIEKAVPARELECAVLEDTPSSRASGIGEIIPHHEFYSYEAKYLDENGADLKIPAEITNQQVKEIQELSLRAFEVLELKGLARVDFFMDKENGKLYLNEVNTMPGFTKISMYPKLWEASGLKYPDLLDHLIQLAITRHKIKAQLKTEFDGARKIDSK